MSAAPGDPPSAAAPPVPAAPLPAPAGPAPVPPVPDRPPTDPARRAFLAVAAVLLFGWFAWLSYAALNKSRDPIVPRVQAAVAPVPVRATVTVGDRDKGTPGTKAVVVEALRADGPPANATLVVTNLPLARGFAGDGEYLLLLAPDPLASLDGAAAYRLIEVRTSGAEAEPPTVYRWTPDVAAQAERLFRAKD